MLASDRAVNKCHVDQEEEGRVFRLSLFSLSLAVRSWWEAHPCAPKSSSANTAVPLVIVGSLRIGGGNPPWVICPGSGWAGLWWICKGVCGLSLGAAPSTRRFESPFGISIEQRDGKDLDRLKICPRRQRLHMCAQLAWAYWCNALMFHFGGAFFPNADLEKSCSDDVKIRFLCKLHSFYLCRHRISRQTEPQNVWKDNETEVERLHQKMLNWGDWLEVLSASDYAQMQAVHFKVVQPGSLMQTLAVGKGLSALLSSVVF